MACVFVLIFVVLVVLTTRLATCTRLRPTSTDHHEVPLLGDEDQPSWHHGVVDSSHAGDQVHYQALDIVPSIISREASTTTTSPTGLPTVMECFQVAQPVLTPKGASHQLTTNDGSTNAADSGSACTVLLMDHVFAFSYGLPFVGELASCFAFSRFSFVSHMLSRELHATQLQVQSGGHELHGCVGRPTV
jgi:hypothetical protein